MHPGRAVALVAALGGAATVAALLVPGVPVAYQGQTLHVFFETSEGFIKLTAAYLVFGRLRRTRVLNDAGLVYALVLLAVGSLLVSALPGTRWTTGTSFLAWTAISTHFFGSLFFGAAGASRDRIMRFVPRASLLLFMSFATLTAIAVTMAWLSPRLPAGIDPVAAEGRPLREIWFSASPALHAMQFGTMTAYVVASLGFLERARENRDDLMLWLAAGCALLAVARMNYFLFPSFLTNWVYLGDVIRYTAHLVILYGAAKEISSYWHALAENAVVDERRRMARDLHDGLAQELTFIWRESRKLGGDSPMIPMISSAAERALDESRQAIAALTRPADEPAATSISKAALQVAERAGINVKFVLDEDITVDPETRETLMRIVREAVSNAAKHSEAEQVRVTLEADDAIRLEICDDGRGFSPDGVDKGYTFGLVSMRERAENMGGRFNLTSQPGEGTSVEVVLPYQINAEGRIVLSKKAGRPG